MPIGFLRGGVSDSLRTFLQLTDAQVRDLNRINREFGEWQMSRIVRQAEVRSEIVIEERKSPLDPMALGLRYAELESTRREVEDESGRVKVRVQALLTAPQKEKTKELERARALLPLISEADCINLLTPPAEFNVIPTARIGFAATTSGCIIPFFTALP